MLETIKTISIAGYKSVYQEQSIDLAPLTVLAGANSSGKSSLMQPLLLLKQTLEASYDPGPLLLNGSHVKFTSAEQLLSHLNAKQCAKELSIRLRGEDHAILATYQKAGNGIFSIARMELDSQGNKYEITPGMSKAQILKNWPGADAEHFNGEHFKNAQWEVRRERCFLVAGFTGWVEPKVNFIPVLSPAAAIANEIEKIIHLPGLRGNPERNYPPTVVENDKFCGTFEKYVASIIRNWQLQKNQSAISQLEDYLGRLGLTSKIEARQLDAISIELRVGHVTAKSLEFVSIADVGIGVSQVLPVLVALLVAQPGQLVYVEQPEIHLHPKAQVELAGILAEAALRGVKVVIETHSALLLRGIQIVVAKGQLPPSQLKLHWFKRDAKGATTVETADIDENGAFGDWPEDFGEVELATEQTYLDEVMQRGEN